MQSFADTCDLITSRQSRLEKIAALADYLKTCSDDDLDAAARFFTGNPLPPGEAPAAIGSRTLIEAASEAYRIEQSALRQSYRATGDLGEALAGLYAPPLTFDFLRRALRPGLVRDALREAAGFHGPDAGLARRRLITSLFSDAGSAREIAALVKIITGELRIGAREGMIIDAIARAFNLEVDAIRRAFRANGDAGTIAVAAKQAKLDAIAPSYGRALGFMLATPMRFGGGYDEVASGAWIVEQKYDGIRVQLHRDDSGAQLFSRNGREISASFPEIITAALTHLTLPCMLDGELIAYRNRRPLPFRMLQPRLARTNVDEALMNEIPVAFFAFDLLARQSEFLLDETLAVRHAHLDALFEGHETPHLARAAVQTFTQLDVATVEGAFTAARESGHEGLIFKNLASAYTPGRRGKSWIKLKRELTTLDVVVTGVEWGHGKRKKMLSDYTFAIRNGAELLTLGKAYSGLTDAEITTLTSWFLEHQTGEPIRRRIPVEPQIILEIAFDIIQPSTLHDSGYALRFPRIVRLRDDKPVDEINTLEDVENIYRLMLDREMQPE